MGSPASAYNPAMNTDHTNHSRVVRIATAPNEMVAEMWRDILQDEGIVVALQPDGAAWGMGMNALNAQHLLVREDQAQRALDVLAELDAEESDNDA